MSIVKKAIICYLSYSGNTKEVAEMLSSSLDSEGYLVDMYKIGFGFIPDLSIYDLILIGTFTWDKGSTPDDMKDFISDIGYKPSHVFVFGTGDTQFGGDELFCKATDKVARFYNSKYKALKIEQSPEGQEHRVLEWIEGVIKIDRETKGSKNIRTNKSE